MRENTYIKIETLYRKYRGYVETKNLLAEGFSNRQISTLVNEGYLQRCAMDIIGFQVNNVRSRLIINVSK